MTIIASVQDRDHLAMLTRAGHRIGHQVRPIEPARHGEIGRIHAFVFDLAPWDGSALEHLRALRTRYPHTPVLLCPPIVEQLETLLLACSTMPCVRAMVLMRPASQAKLEAALRQTLAAGPGALLMQLLDLLLHERAPAAAAYVRAIIGTLDHDLAEVEGPSAKRVVAGMGVSLRTLQRQLDGAALPNPKRFLDWTTLLWIAARGSFSGAPVGRVAATLGIGATRSWRLRQRLLPQGGQPASSDALFDVAFLAFAEVCGVRKEKAAEILEARSA